MVEALSQGALHYRMQQYAEAHGREGAGARSDGYGHKNRRNRSQTIAHVREDLREVFLSTITRAIEEATPLGTLRNPGKRSGCGFSDQMIREAGRRTGTGKRVTHDRNAADIEWTGISVQSSRERRG